MEYIKSILTQNLLSMRKSKGLTQAQLSEKLGVTQASYNRWENGTSWPDAETIETISSFYGVSSTLFFYDPNLNTSNQITSTPLNKKELISKLEEVISALKL